MRPNANDPRSDAPLEIEGHRKPVTRRDFLSRGLISGTAMVMAPSLLGMLARPGVAQAVAGGTCPPAVHTGRIPFICFDLAGGASVAGSNVLVGGPLGQLDPLSEGGYLKLGLPSDMLPTDPAQINTELGLAFHADSAFLRGIVSKTSIATRANINGTVICTRSENDTQNNPHNPMYGIAKAGATGNIVTLVGTNSSESGGKSQAPMSMIDPAVRPTKIDRPQDVTGLVDTGRLVELLPDPSDAGEVMDAVKRLSDLKLAKMNEQQMVKDLLSASYLETADLVRTFGDPAQLDPLLDVEITGQPTSIFSTDEVGQTKFRRTASVMKLVNNGYAGAGTIELGGYDYHDSTRAKGEIRDFEAGQCMGACLEYAARSCKQLMLYVFSDGSVSCDGTLDNSADGRGKGIWKSDNSSTASVFILAYDPAGPPQLLDPARAQIGHFRSSGSVETGATRVSNNVGLLAQAIVLNYLALHDEVGRIEEVLPGHGLGSGAELDSLVAFQPIRSSGA